jgi:hypothetical protein
MCSRAAATLSLMNAIEMCVRMLVTIAAVAAWIVVVPLVDTLTPAREH